MSIIIHGIDMPKEGTFDMIHIHSDGSVAFPFWGRGMEAVPGVKAEQLPPHGRLIDADALHYSRVRIYHEDGTVGGYNAVVMSAEIKDATTIIEAEGEKE